MDLKRRLAEMTWFTVVIILLIAVAATALFSAMAFISGFVCSIRRTDAYVKKQADKMVDRLLKERIGKTLAGVNDGKKYSWKVHFDNDGEDKCNTTRFGVDADLSDVINMVNRRAIEWGCDITCIEVKREDADSV
jgi:hypothetical protein